MTDRSFWENNQTEPCLPGFEYEDYNKSLAITSEADLLTTDASGQSVYEPFTDEDYDKIEAYIRRLGEDLGNAISGIKWAVDKEFPDGTRLYLTISNLNHQMVSFIRYVRKCHRKLIRSIYAEHISDTGKLYEDHLRKPIEDYSRIITNIKDSSCRCCVDPSVFDGIFHGFYCNTGKWFEDHHCNLNDFHELMTIYTQEDLDIGLNDTLHLTNSVYKVLAEIRQTRITRSNAEQVIIFDYLQKTYNEQLYDRCTDLEKYPFYRKHRGFFNLSCMKMDSTGLRALQTDIKQRYKDLEIVKVWEEYHYDDNLSAEEKENLVYQIVKINPTKDDFHKLFDYQMESVNVLEQLRKRVEYETNGDPMFSVWVDPERLKEYLDPWIRANIESQREWFVVWCLMKYTFSMLKEDVDIQRFADRMNQMFDWEKSCKYESIRKLVNTLSHNKHFSEWLQNDPDYALASSLDIKLSKKDYFKRQSDIAFQ